MVYKYTEIITQHIKGKVIWVVQTDDRPEFASLKEAKAYVDSLK